MDGTAAVAVAVAEGELKEQGGTAVVGTAVVVADAADAAVM
jgi:hypothetical protein